jgi:hypothetical protein
MMMPSWTWRVSRASLVSRVSHVSHVSRVRKVVVAAVTMTLLAAMDVVMTPAIVRAHSGPPFPIVSNRIVGAYDISIWTDPDATDDGQAGGQFWVVIHAADRETGASGEVPAETRVTVAIRPAGGTDGEQHATATPVDGQVSRQFAATLMDHEGRFDVRVMVEGPLGRVELSSAVDATYDQRPAPILLVVYLLPFVAIGALWMARLRRRRVVGSR